MISIEPGSWFNTFTNVATQTNTDSSSLVTLIFIIIALLALSAMNSGLEMALASINRIRIKSKSENGDKKAQKVLNLIENYERSSTTIIVFNNIVNILLASVASSFFITVSPKYGVLMSTIIMTILILIFGEIVPKIYGVTNPEKMLYALEPFLNASIKILKPIVLVFLAINRRIQRLFESEEEDEIEYGEVEEEILTIIQESEDEGKIEAEDGELIRNAVEFNETRVSEIYSPKHKFVSISVDDDIEEILTVLKREKFSRVPVYEGDSDNIVGILYERDFYMYYTADKNVNIREIMREPIHVPDTMKIQKLLVSLQQKHSHMSIVVDERGTVVGLCTMEDIIEELVGEIWDEHESVEYEYVKLSDNKFEVSGNFSINEFNDLFEKEDIAPETDEDTIAGYILELAERIPDNGEIIEDNDFLFTVQTESGKKIDTIIVELK
ncbi:hemolysin family protein [Mollicutes bacterium LVI A0078]|nr:hemolysin family protein [Mollicutes bacterium LVI A0075]WOO90915.1 hemolysin family protein [Mollicutes bacterium LVI A0078]